MKNKIILMLLRWLGYRPGSIVRAGKRTYVIDIDGARRRVGRESIKRESKVAR